MAQSFTDGYVTTIGVAITKVLPPMPYKKNVITLRIAIDV
jgi:hypothetical protein